MFVCEESSLGISRNMWVEFSEMRENSSKDNEESTKQKLEELESNFRKFVTENVNSHFTFYYSFLIFCFLKSFLVALESSNVFEFEEISRRLSSESNTQNIEIAVQEQLNVLQSSFTELVSSVDFFLFSELKGFFIFLIFVF